MDMAYKIFLNDHVPAGMLNLAAEIDEFKGRWEALKNIAPDRLSALRKVATIASIGSSTRIEGAHLSNSEVERLLSNIGRHSFANRDEEEVAGYSDAMNLVFDSFGDITVSENHIRQLHGILLKHSGRDRRHKGEYKKNPNDVEAFNAQGESVGVVFETATPFDTPFFMKDLVAWYNGEIASRAFHPLLVIGGFAVHFLAIHPFQDGNGRLSRILTALMLLRSGYAYVPYCSLESIVEENKERYYLALRRAQMSFKTDHADMIEWLRFFLTLMKKQKDILAGKLEKEKAFSMESLPALAGRLLVFASERERLTLSDIVKCTEANRNTVKKHVQSLVRKGLLLQHGKGKGTWYSRADRPPAT